MSLQKSSAHSSIDLKAKTKQSLLRTSSGGEGRNDAVQLLPIMIYSGARQFVNPLGFLLFLHKYEIKRDQIFTEVVK